jgi:hypothetical protein
MAVLTQMRTGRVGPLARRGCLALLLLATAAAAVGAAENPPPVVVSAEYRVKAGFLFNFPQFVEWPTRAFREAQAPIVIGILGDDPFGPYLDELVQGEKIGARPLLVQRFRRVEEIGDCHVLFLSRSEAGKFDAILARLRGRAILTVGEDESLERAGGMVRFTIENNKVRLRINPEAAKTGELTISSKLLRLATLVPATKE